MGMKGVLYAQLLSGRRCNMYGYMESAHYPLGYGSHTDLVDN